MVKTQDLNDPLIVSILKKYDRGKLFDYGCGDGRLTYKVAQLGYKIIAFDINEDLINNQKQKNENILFLTEKEFKLRFDCFKTFFNIILCSLVLCVIEDDEEVKMILKNCSIMLKPEGLFVLSLCNPFYTWVKETELQTKFLPEDFRYENKTKYFKKMKSSEHIREDIHRPFSFYENILNKNDFKIVEIHQTIGKNLHCELFASDFLIILCKK